MKFRFPLTHFFPPSATAKTKSSSSPLLREGNFLFLRCVCQGLPFWWNEERQSGRPDFRAALARQPNGDANLCVCHRPATLGPASPWINTDAGQRDRGAASQQPSKSRRVPGSLEGAGGGQGDQNTPFAVTPFRHVSSSPDPSGLPSSEKTFTMLRFTKSDEMSL